MTLEELLQLKKPPEKFDLGNEELNKFFWKHKGLLKERERANAFWSATNENLKTAYEKLDEKDKELEKAYSIIQEDLSVASQIQNTLLPKPLEIMEQELEIAIYHKQLAEVGGDYYDFFKVKNGRYSIGLFDISGHGVPAALVMTYLKALFMQVITLMDSPKEIVEWVNKTSFEFLKASKKYSTVNFVTFDPDKIRYVCGGGFGMLLHEKTANFFNKKDHFIGLREKPFTEYELPFSSGDILALYTDGIVEAQNVNEEDYTIKRLNNSIISNAEKPVSEIMDICLNDYKNFRNRDCDDITLIILRKK